MAQGSLSRDRYSPVMAGATTNEKVVGPDGALIGEGTATFEFMQRKVPYTVALGHRRLQQGLLRAQLDHPRADFLARDRAGLARLVERLKEKGSFSGRMRLVKEGTIIFRGEPFGDVEGPFWNVQLYEVNFEHAFDVGMTVAYIAMEIREAAGDETSLSVFSLRRDGDPERSVRVSETAIICGFDDTSDMEAAFLLGVDSVGTMAHYLVLAFIQYLMYPQLDESGKPKHFERVAFEMWLDANPNGTVLLIDTIDSRYGVIHAIQAALSSPERKHAFRAIRIDSGDLIKQSRFCRKLLDANGLNEVVIILTGDLDADKIREIREALDFPIKGFGIGTKLNAEVESVAGVIFKICLMNGIPVLKLSGTAGKETLPGRHQVWRCVDKDGYYVRDIIALIDEPKPKGEDFVDAIPLLQPFTVLDQTKSPQELRVIVAEQKKKFKVSLKEYPVVLSERLEALKKTVAEAIKDKERFEDMGIAGMEEALAELEA